MEWQHPVFLEMLQMGCSSPLKVMSTFQTYMKLCEVDRVHEIDFFYSKELDSVYLKSVSGKKTIVHFIIPSNQDLSPSLLHKISTDILKEHEGAELNIVLKTPDTSLLSYKVTGGLCPPPTPEMTKLKKTHQEQIHFVQNEMHKRKAELYEEAKRKKWETLDVKEEHKPDTSEKSCSDIGEPRQDCVESNIDCVEPDSNCLELEKDIVEAEGYSAKELEIDDSDSADFKGEL